MTDLSLKAKIEALRDKWNDQAGLLEQSAERHRAMSSVGLAHPEEISARELRNCIRQLAALLTSVEPPAPKEEKVTTYTPMIWALLSEERRYEEYVRVRNLLSAAEPPPETTQKEQQ